MIEVLTWISLICGGLLILLLLLSLLGGLELDFDLSDGDVDLETDSGGLGIVKGALTFISVSCWVVRIIWITDKHPAIAFSVGLLAGIAAVWLLSWMLSFLLKQQADVNWNPSEAILATAKVYLRVPSDKGFGIVQVHLKGRNRELKARSLDGEAIPTGETVFISEYKEGIAYVSKFDRNY